MEKTNKAGRKIEITIAESRGAAIANIRVDGCLTESPYARIGAQRRGEATHSIGKILLFAHEAAQLQAEIDAFEAGNEKIQAAKAASQREYQEHARRSRIASQIEDEQARRNAAWERGDERGAFGR